MPVLLTMGVAAPPAWPQDQRRPDLEAGPDRARALAQEAPIHVELNAAESAQSHCRLSFVVENKADKAIDTLKLDLAVFGQDGGIQRRLVVEMGPVRAAKTIVRTFDIEPDCPQIGSILLNDVTACTPGDPASCLDRLTLSSRPPNIKFYK